MRCRYAGREYKVGEHFVPEDCRGHCKCQLGEDGRSTKMICEPVCKSTDISCEPGETLEIKRKVLPESSCSCDIPFCKPAEEGMYRVHICVNCTARNLLRSQLATK